MAIDIATTYTIASEGRTTGIMLAPKNIVTEIKIMKRIILNWIGIEIWKPYK